MKRFIRDIIISISLIIIIAELTARFFELKSQYTDLISKDYEGFYSLKPNSKGNFVFGKMPVVNRTKYNINDIGFNTSLNYEDFNDEKINVAFVGDSFVESFNVNYFDSFSSILMNESTLFQSYDFGVGSYNLEDYIWIYKKFNLEKFDYVFFVVNRGDLSNFPARKKYNPLKEKFRKFYNSIHFFNYINSNHKIIYSLRTIFNKKFNYSSKMNDFVLNTNQKMFLSKSNLIILPRDKETCEYLKKEKINNIIEIKHTIKPIDFGQSNFHWNKNGRINVISTIIPYISPKKSD